MTLNEPAGALRPAIPSIDAVLAAHGARKVLAAAVAAMLRGKHRKTRPPDLPLDSRALLRAVNAHLARDIGLHPAADPARRWPL